MTATQRAAKAAATAQLIDPHTGVALYVLQLPGGQWAVDAPGHLYGPFKDEAEATRRMIRWVLGRACA